MTSTKLLDIKHKILSLSPEEQQQLFSWMSQQINQSPQKEIIQSTETSPAEILRQIAKLPLGNQETAFSGRDHDRILYSQNENL